MTLTTLLGCMESGGVRVSAELEIEAPGGWATPEMMEAIRSHRAELLCYAVMLAEAEAMGSDPNRGRPRATAEQVLADRGTGPAGR
jgi:hypothetical protein